MIRKLRLKFVCINMALVLAMLLLIFVLVYSFTRTGMEQNVRQALQTAIQGEVIPHRPGDQQIPCFILEVTGFGRITVSGTAYFDLTDQQLLQDICQSVSAQNTREGILEAYGLQFRVERIPVGVRYAFADITYQHNTLKALVRSCLIIGLLALGGFLGISIALAWWAVGPVERAWIQQKQFVADASHELKTPLTVILTNSELLQSEDYPQEEKLRFSQSIHTMAKQMRGLVEGMLDLARVDNGQAKQAWQPVDLSSLAEEVLLPFEPMYFEQQLSLSVQAEPGLTVNGSAGHLRQVLEILLDNGQKYSTPGGTVTLSLERCGRGRIQLTFVTPGQPMTPQQCRDIFKRFYRIDPARSRDGSYGLGLAIAESIISAHGGKIWAQGRADCNRFFISLPEA